MAGGLISGTVTVDTTATGGEVIVNGRSTRSSVVIQNTSTTVDVFVGGLTANGGGLTTANGLKIAAGQSLSFTDLNGSLYGIVASGSADVRYLEVF